MHTSTEAETGTMRQRQRGGGRWKGWSDNTLITGGWHHHRQRGQLTGLGVSFQPSELSKTSDTQRRRRQMRRTRVDGLIAETHQISLVVGLIQTQIQKKRISPQEPQWTGNNDIRLSGKTLFSTATWWLGWGGMLGRVGCCDQQSPDGGEGSRPGCIWNWPKAFIHPLPHACGACATPLTTF